jgi:hypothetical protein
VSGKNIISSLWDLISTNKFYFTDILSLRDSPVRDFILVEK